MQQQRPKIELTEEQKQQLRTAKLAILQSYIDERTALMNKRTELLRNREMVDGRFSKDDEAERLSMQISKLHQKIYSYNAFHGLNANVKVQRQKLYDHSDYVSKRYYSRKATAKAKRDLQELQAQNDTTTDPKNPVL